MSVMRRVMLASVSLAIGSAIAVAQRAPQSPDFPLPAAAREFPPDPEFNPYAPPWVFAADRTTTHPLALLKTAGESMAVALDDGTGGTVRAESDPCTKDQADCYFPDDRLALVISDGAGKVIARGTFTTGYGSFAATPVDLVGGPGDELVIVTGGRGSPPSGLFMDIWQVGTGTFMPLLHGMKIEGNVPSRSINCVRWRYDVVVGTTSLKPRPLLLKGRIGYRGPCSTDAEGAAELGAVLRGQTVRFSGGTYRTP
jgi:hypothetical protein